MAAAAGVIASGTSIVRGIETFVDVRAGRTTAGVTGVTCAGKLDAVHVWDSIRAGRVWVAWVGGGTFVDVDAVRLI
jgi:hypothetical protein